MDEPDWKRYKPLRKLAIERFCTGVFKETADIAAQSDGTAHDRYRELYRLVKERDKEIVQLFDPLSRSRATMQLIGLCRFGLVTEDELTIFSNDLQVSVRSTIDLLEHPG